MKKIIFLLTAFSFFATAFASTGIGTLNSPKNANTVFLPIGNNMQNFINGPF